MKRKLQSITIVLIAIVSMISFSQDIFAQTQRNPVLEYCTGTWCVYCPQGHAIIQNTILPNIPNAIIIGYHGPTGYGDPFAGFPGYQIMSTLGFSSYPTGIVDRVSGIQSRSAWYGLMNTRNSVPATVAIDLERSFNKTTREFNATVDLTALTNLSGQYKFNVILLESGMVWAQTGGTTNYVHHHVVRAMMNGYLGEEVINGTWNQNDVITKTVNYTVPVPPSPSPDIVWDSCNVVVMVYKVGSPLSSAAEIQQAEEWILVSPDYVASFASTSPDIIGDKNVPGEFNTWLQNMGLLDDMYYITCTFDGPGGWTGGFETINGPSAFGETDSVQVATGDSTELTVTINPNGFTGTGEATLSFQSKNDPGMAGDITFRLVTTSGINILVVDASGEGYGELVANSVENVFSGSTGLVSRSALNASAVLDDFQMVTWSAGTALPAFYPDEVDLLQGYLDNGGKLFINGQDIGFDVFDPSGQSQFAQAFYNNYMHATFSGNGTSFLINGVPGDPITNGVQFVLNDVYTRSPDNIGPFDNNASSIFIYLNGPNVAGIKAATNNYKVVYFGFGFEQITDTAIRDTLVSRIINWSGVTPTNLADNEIIPYEFSLGQNYPNPFNPSTRITYSLNNEVQVNLSVYDMLGRKVAELVNERQGAGAYELEFDASSLASGIYLYKLSAGDFVSVKKMTLLK